MSTRTIHLNHHIQNNVAFITLSGNLTARPTGAPFHTRIAQLVKEGTCRVVVDLSNINWIDAAMLGELAVGLKILKDAGGELLLSGVSRKVEKILNVTRLSSAFGKANCADSPPELRCRKLSNVA